jgi:succinyl-diaminopimelate desuccinylase
MIPGKAEARFNIRFNDRWTADTLRSRLMAQCEEAAGGADWRLKTWSNAEAFVTPPGPFVDLVGKAAREVSGLTPELSTGGGTSDARFITRHCPVVELGLVGRTMHQVDEHVPIADLERLTAIYRSVLARYFERMAG